MKKFLSMLLALMLLLSSTAFATESEDENYYFEAGLTSALDRSSFEWYATDSNRAMLTLVLYIDALLDYEGDLHFEASVLSHSSYVARDSVTGTLTVVVLSDEGDSMWIYFEPETELAAFIIIEDLDELGVEYVLSTTDKDYYENDVIEIFSALELIKSALE